MKKKDHYYFRRQYYFVYSICRLFKNFCINRNSTPGLLVLFLALLLPLSFSRPLPAQSHLTLDQAIKDALRRSETLQQAALEVNYLSSRTRLTEKNKLFQVNFDGNYLYRSQTIVLELPALPSPLTGQLTPLQIEGGLKHNYDLNLSLTQPLFTGGQLTRAVELSRLQKLMALDQKSLVINRVISQVVSSFYRYQLLEAHLNSASNIKKRLELHHQRLQHLVEEELSRRVNLLETLSKIEEMENSLLEIKQLIQEERLTFHRLCGHYPEEIEPGYTERALNLNQALAYLEENHPFLRQLDKQIQAIELQKKMTSGRYLPQLAARAEVHYGKPGINFFKKEWSLYFQGGITLKVPLFDWRKKKEELTMLDYKIRQLQTEKQKFLADTKKALASLYARLELLQAKMKHLQKMADYAREKTQLKQQLWQEKLIPHLEYLTALSEEEKLTWSLEEIKFELQLTRVAINSYIGHYREVNQ